MPKINRDTDFIRSYGVLENLLHHIQMMYRPYCGVPPNEDVIEDLDAVLSPRKIVMCDQFCCAFLRKG